jgi:polyhydroxyalkanoate synthase
MNQTTDLFTINPWLKWQRSLMDEGFANARRMMQLPFLAQKAQSVRKGASPSEVVYEEDRLKVLHYLSDAEPRYRTPLVFVFALVNRPYILDLKEGRSVVSHFVKAGFDTYLIDWGAPTDSDRHLTLDDYINGYMANAVDYVCERTGSPQVNVLG